MKNLLWVGAGGFIGATLRYVVSGLVQQMTHSIAFPYGTFTVNVVGCFFLGALSHLVENQVAVSAEMRLLLMVGILGSFTTYSTFSNETFTLIQDQRFFLAAVNMGAHLLIGLVAVFLGRVGVMTLWG